MSEGLATGNAGDLHGGAEPVVLPQVRASRHSPPWLMHSGMTASRFVGMHAMGALFPLTAGVILFGWRALGATLIVLGFTIPAVFAWRRVGARGGRLQYGHCLWLGVLLAITLPAHLCVLYDSQRGIALWPVLAAGGILLVIFTWLLGGVGAGRVHPVLVTHLLLFVCFKDLLVPHYVLQRKHVVAGDLFSAMTLEHAATVPWARMGELAPYDSLRMEPASQTLVAFTSGSESSDHAWTSLDSLLRDRMPPLEDLIVGGHPAPLGLGSTIAIIVGGLFLLYRGLIDSRVPLIIILAAAATMLLLPVPVVIKESDVVWRWAAFHVPNVGWPIGMTLVNYELLAGPLVFMAFFLATSTAVRPIALRARVVYALIAGILTGVFQLYFSVSVGPYLALLFASALTPTLDKVFKARTLV